MKPVTNAPRAAKSLIVSEGDQELRALMIRYQGGSLEAFQEIYAQLAPGVRRYLSHLAGGSEIADDLLQKTFLQMHRSRAAYNPAYAVRPWGVRFGAKRFSDESACGPALGGSP